MNTDGGTRLISDVIKEKCAELGWTYTIKGKIFSIEKKFKANSDAVFNAVQAEGFGIIKMMPTTAPSVTYGLENPRYVEYAKQRGVIKLSKSSCNGRILTLLKK